MNIDFEKSHPAVNIEAKRECYEGFFRVSIILSALIAILLLGMGIFLT